MTKLELLKTKEARMVSKIEELKQRALASTEVNEVRSLTEMVNDINEELSLVREEIAIEERSKDFTITPPADAKKINGDDKRSFGEGEDMEYRKAFMKYIQSRGAEVPSELRSATSTTDLGVMIPTTVMNEVIGLVKGRYGNLYRKARKLSVQGGVEFPLANLSATFHWIGEDEVAPRESAGSIGKISFKYHTAEIRLATSFLANLLSLSAFEGALAELIAEAYVKALDIAIVKGSGEGSPLGIINDARVTKNVSFTEAEFSDWTKWRKKFFASLGLGYRGGEFIFPISTVDTYLETMQDSNGRPIFREATGLEVNDGDALNPSARFFGREVSLVENDVLPDFSTANNGDVVGIYWYPNEYGINENFGFSVRKYFDEETNEWVNKALVVVDGKVLDANCFVLIKKSST